MKQLGVVWNVPLPGMVTAAENDANSVHATKIANQEVWSVLSWIWTRAASVAKMNLKAKLIEHPLVKKSTCPFLYTRDALMLWIRELLPGVSPLCAAVIGRAM